MLSNDANEKKKWMLKRVQTWYGSTQYTPIEAKVNVYGILNVHNVCICADVNVRLESESCVVNWVGGWVAPLIVCVCVCEGLT